MELWGPYKCPYEWLTGVITLLLKVITPLKTGRGPPLLEHTAGSQRARLFLYLFGFLLLPSDYGLHLELFQVFLVIVDPVYSQRKRKEKKRSVHPLNC